ncbi:hypothetical protein IWX50DRAFT_45916 [Phyllosticta citricarpa]|uniref:Secreted protein n=1 Tax=Phyllosticta citricarpa TaxID=55181 RepID=A0ABR1MPI3_9PEZI
MRPYKDYRQFFSTCRLAFALAVRSAGQLNPLARLLVLAPIPFCYCAHWTGIAPPATRKKAEKKKKKKKRSRWNADSISLCDQEKCGQGLSPARPRELDSNDRYQSRSFGARKPPSVAQEEVAERKKKKKKEKIKTVMTCLTAAVQPCIRCQETSSLCRIVRPELILPLSSPMRRRGAAAATKKAGHLVRKQSDYP